MVMWLWMSRLFTARIATGIFFPQRLALRIDGRSYSPTALERLILCSSTIPSFDLAAKLAGQLTGIRISGRHLQNLTAMVGQELSGERDAAVEKYYDKPLPRKPKRPSTPIALACVSIDGGRMQTRLDRCPTGVHSPHWRETKNTLFLRMNDVSFTADPHPELPRCYSDRRRMRSLLPGVEEENSQEKGPRKSSREWLPEKLFRTSLSSMADSQAFGKMMAAEADSRGFYCAQKQAYVCDGLPPKDAEEKDPRKIVADTIRYFQNNASKMDYPRYRKEGLPTTSALMESLVKEVNYRVKGTEKFWNDGPNAEAILQVRAATLGDDDRLSKHLQRRPGCPFRPNVKKTTVLALAG